MDASSIHRRLLNRTIGAAIVAALVAGCAAPGPTVPSNGDEALTAESLLNESPLQGTDRFIEFSGFDMLGLNPAMIEFLNVEVKPAGGEGAQLRYLTRAIMRSGTYTLDYSDDTGSAIDTFVNRRGNCMGFTNMFVAMARYLGLDAKFQEVEVPSSWTLDDDGETFVSEEHINVRVNLMQGRWQEVDFNSPDFEHNMESRIVPDERARAHYYNNLGAEKLLAGNTRLALAYLRQALLEDRRFVPAWINMGILHRRLGYPGHAEVALLEAISIERDNLTAASNLVSLYQELGNEEQAERYRASVHTYRMRNPYYRYKVAQKAFEDEDYSTAIRDLKWAIRRIDDDDRFFRLLSASYLMNGDPEQAENWMNKAEETALADSEEGNAGSEIDVLMGPGGSVRGSGLQRSYSQPLSLPH